MAIIRLSPRSFHIRLTTMPSQYANGIAGVGTVKWFDSKKGYGFIATDSGLDILVHFAVIEGSGFRRLFRNDRVVFDAAQGSGGFYATRVRQINSYIESVHRPV
jgi:CspA family cold shock protein